MLKGRTLILYESGYAEYVDEDGWLRVAESLGGIPDGEITNAYYHSKDPFH